MRDVKRIVEQYGDNILLIPGDETNLKKDDYGSIIGRQPGTSPNGQTIKSFPIRFNPTTKDLEKAGIAERVEVVFYLSKLRADELGIVIPSKITDTVRMKIVYRGISFRLRDRGWYSQFGDEFLYITLGGMRK
jgi:hypothetical protein